MQTTKLHIGLTIAALVIAVVALFNSWPSAGASVHQWPCSERPNEPHCKPDATTTTVPVTTTTTKPVPPTTTTTVLPAPKLVPPIEQVTPPTPVIVTPHFTG